MLLLGIAVFVVSLPLVHLSRRLFLGKERWNFRSTRRKALETICIAWFIWTLGITLVPLNRLEAWVDYGGVLVTGITPVLMGACLRLKAA